MWNFFFFNGFLWNVGTTLTNIGIRLILLVSIGTKYVGVVTLKTIESVELVTMVQIVSSVSIWFSQAQIHQFFNEL